MICPNHSGVGVIHFAHRHIVVAPVALAALCAPPVLIPDVMAQGHVAVDLLVALGLGRATLGHVVLLLSTLDERTN